MNYNFDELINIINNIKDYEISGIVSGIKGNLIECFGISQFVSIGSRCKIINKYGNNIIGEVIGFEQDKILMVPFNDIEGVGVGCKVVFVADQKLIYPDQSWLGRILNSHAEPVDDKGELANGIKPYSIKNAPPSSHQRNRVGQKIDLGIKSINTFISCCYGQRMGIFAGSGVGKSMLIAMLTRFADADVKIIGLIGERGREVQEFIQDYLGEEGLKQSVLVIATGDESALSRRQAAYTTMTIAEYFRDQGKTVLCIIDSVTRFAMAQREIGLAAGEPPTTKAYTPTVFSELPKLLERAGPGTGQGSITGMFSVLVEGDDHNEPIADAVRGILDGHIILDRAIAERGVFPAINILKSISRTMPGCNNDAENQLITKARKIISTYSDMSEMIKIGAYKPGSNPEVDEAIKIFPQIEQFFIQMPKEYENAKTSYQKLANILDFPWQNE